MKCLYCNYLGKDKTKGFLKPKVNLGYFKNTNIFGVSDQLEIQVITWQNMTGVFIKIS